MQLKTKKALSFCGQRSCSAESSVVAAKPLYFSNACGVSRWFPDRSTLGRCVEKIPVIPEWFCPESSVVAAKPRVSTPAA